MQSPEIAALEAALGHRFHRPELLEQALTHSSQAREQEFKLQQTLRVGDNEQMEFLGDAVLGLVTSEELFHRFPHFREGQLSKLRAHLVSEKHLVKVANQLDLGAHLRLGRGEQMSGGRHKPAILADALEAVLAAIYLDAGLEVARQFILGLIIAPELLHMGAGDGAAAVTDPKSALQEMLQALSRPQPLYVLVKSEGPEHKKLFTVEVQLIPNPRSQPEFTARAQGSTKKKAEQEAARHALEYLAAQSCATAAQP
jgi:ribonuclease-3